MWTEFFLGEEALMSTVWRIRWLLSKGLVLTACVSVRWREVGAEIGDHFLTPDQGGDSGAVEKCVEY